MAMIRNIPQLARTPLRKKALAILEAAYQSLETQTMIRQAVTLENGTVLKIQKHREDLSAFDHVYLVGIGKNAYQSSRALAKIIGSYLTKGLVIDLQGKSFGRVVVRRGTHPFGSEQNVAAAKAVEKFLLGLTDRDLVIAVVSGGGSALLSYPTTVSIAQEVELTKKLMHRGVAIEEMNIVRKHLSVLRGGGMARAAWPARVISLLFSDVSGDDLGTIASGPTVQDRTTADDAARILKKYHIPAVPLLETPKDRRYFRRVKNIVVGSNRVALDAMSREAKRQGLKPRVFSRELQGIALAVGPRLVRACARGEALLAGGETTVEVRRKGKGGRSLELVLSAVAVLPSDAVISSIASDGRDNTDAAGALADGQTLQTAQKKKMDPTTYLRQNASYRFFEKVGDLIFATNRCTNVSDLMLVIKE